MAFEDMDLDFENDFEEEEEPLPEEEGNRTFFIIAGILGGVAILVVICIVVWVLVLLPQQRQRDADQLAMDQQNTEVAIMVQQTSTSAAQTSIAAGWTSTPTETPLPSPTPEPTSTFTPLPTTAVVMVSTTQVGAEDPINATATSLQATANYNADVLQVTLTVQASLTAGADQIPDTGFADNVGLPAFIGVAVLLVVIIFLARRLRSA